MKGANGNPSSFAARHIVANSSAVRTRSRATSRVGGLREATGDTSIIPRSTHQFISFLIAASARFARVGVPEATIASSAETMSVRLISLIAVSSKRSNFRKMLCVPFQSFVFGLACSSMNCSATSTNVGAIAATPDVSVSNSPNSTNRAISAARLRASGERPRRVWPDFCTPSSPICAGRHIENLRARVRNPDVEATHFCVPYLVAFTRRWFQRIERFGCEHLFHGKVIRHPETVCQGIICELPQRNWIRYSGLKWKAPFKVNHSTAASVADARCHRLTNCSRYS